MSGVTAGDGPLHGPQPALLWARTLNCTGWPLVSPVHVKPVWLPTACAGAVADAQLVARRSGAPLDGGAAQLTVAWALPATATGEPGADGWPITVTVTWASDSRGRCWRRHGCGR